MKRVGVIALLTVWLLAGCGGNYELKGTPYDPIVAAPEISGLVGNGEAFSLGDLKDKVKVVFFGYTFCPDVCPLTLANMRTVYDALSDAEKANTAFVLVSVDPERDTPERLATYVTSFSPDFVGVQVPLSNLEKVKADYGVFAQKNYVSQDTSAADYLVDHTAFIYIIDRSDNLREIFPSDYAADEIAADVKHLVATP